MGRQARGRPSPDPKLARRLRQIVKSTVDLVTQKEGSGRLDKKVDLSSMLGRLGAGLEVNYRETAIGPPAKTVHQRPHEDGTAVHFGVVRNRHFKETLAIQYDRYVLTSGCPVENLGGSLLELTVVGA